MIKGKGENFPSRKKKEKKKERKYQKQQVYSTITKSIVTHVYLLFFFFQIRLFFGVFLHGFDR